MNTIFTVLPFLCACMLGWFVAWRLRTWFSEQEIAELRTSLVGEVRMLQKALEQAGKELADERALRIEPGSGKPVDEKPGFDGPTWGTPPRPTVHDDEDDYVDILRDGRRERIYVGSTSDMKTSGASLSKHHPDCRCGQHQRQRINVEAWKETANELEREVRRLREERAELMKGPGRSKMGYVVKGFRFTDQWDGDAPGGGSHWRNTISHAQKDPLLRKYYFSAHAEQVELLEAVQEWCKEHHRTLISLPVYEVGDIWTFRTKG